MKTFYFTFFIFIICSKFISQTAPTCSLDAAFIASNKIGVWPDSATNFLSGNVGSAYVQNLTVKVPKDTIQSSFVRICFNRFVVSTPTTATNYNLPPGLMMGSSTAAVANGTVNGAPSFKFPGNANNCASIYGTPTTVGVYTLQLMVEAYGTPQAIGMPCAASPNVTGGSKLTTQNLAYYIIRINPPVGVKEIGKDKFGIMQNEPNPVNVLSKIKYYVEDEDLATLTVYNTLGAGIYTKISKTNVGENTFEIDAQNWPEGIYFYTVKYKNTTQTKRLIVEHN